MTSADSGRDRILARIRVSMSLRSPVPLPDRLGEPVEVASATNVVIDRFVHQFAAAGGEAVVHPDLRAALAWASVWCSDFPAAAVSASLPDALRPRLPAVAPADAALAVSAAISAAAETGTLLLDSRDGRRLQLLAPAHLVWIPRAAVYLTLRSALRMARGRHGAAIGLHSGPSKSADIGGVLVHGVHGPGRVIAAIVPDEIFAGTR